MMGSAQRAAVRPLPTATSPSTFTVFTALTYSRRTVATRSSHLRKIAKLLKREFPTRARRTREEVLVECYGAGGMLGVLVAC